MIQLPSKPFVLLSATMCCHLILSVGAVKALSEILSPPALPNQTRPMESISNPNPSRLLSNLGSYRFTSCPFIVDCHVYEFSGDNSRASEGGRMIFSQVSPKSELLSKPEAHEAANTLSFLWSKEYGGDCSLTVFRTRL